MRRFVIKIQTKELSNRDSLTEFELLSVSIFNLLEQQDKSAFKRAINNHMLQSSPKIYETPMHVPFPLQFWDVIAKLRGYK